MKKLITYLKALWRRVAESQRNDRRHDCRLTVGSPSGFNSKLMLKLVSVLVLILTLGVGNVWGDPTVLFHETFGNNTGSARVWSDTCSVKSGVSAVYSGITGYTVSNCKQGKNTTGSTQSGLNQTTQGTDAYIIIGPLNVASYSSLGVTYQWKAGSIKGTYTTKLYYATSSGGSYTEVSGTGTGATTFVERSYSLPVAAQVSTLYLKIVWNTSNTQAIIDEVELTGTAAATSTLTVSESSISGLTYVQGSGPSAAQTFTVSGSNLTSNVTVTAPTNFEVSKDGSSYAGSQTITASGTLSATTIYVRLKSGLAVNSYSGDITVASTGATSKTVSLSGSVTAPAYTVQFSTGTGNPTVSSRTEASGGAGITLPAGPTPACSGDGWVFMGWKETSAQSSTTTAPDLLAAGSTYHPASNCTLYAVYYKPADSNPNNFTKVTSNSANLTSGYYVIYANGEAMNNVLTSNKIAGKSVSESSSGVITSTDADIIWTIYKSGDYYQLYNASINKYLEVEGSNDLGLNATSKGFTLLAFNTSTGQVSLKSVNQTSYQFQYYSGNFSAYGSQSTAIYFYKRGGTYNSNPTCCTQLGSVTGIIGTNTPTSVTLTWSAVSGAEKYQVKVPGSSSHNDWTDAVSGVSVTKSCGTAYTAYFRAIDTNGSHCSEGPESTLAIPAVSWTVSPTISNGTASPAIPGTTCSGFSTTISPETGYALPAEVAVTNADKTWNSSTGALTISNVTGNVEITITCAAESCSGQYTFAYGATPQNDDPYITNPTKECFSQVSTTTEYQITGFTIPNTNTYYWVGYNGYYYNSNIGPGGSSNPGSERNQFKYMPVANLQGSSCGGTGDSYKHTAAGAYGTLRIFSDSNTKNLYVGFVPAGYFMRYGSGESWSNIQLTREGSSAVWKSAIMEMDAATIAKNFNIRIFSGASYDANSEGVAINNWTNGGSTISSMQRKTNSGDNWASGVTAGMRGFFRTWTDNCANNGYCHFVPVHRIVYHANWPVSGSPADTYSVDVSVEETNSSIELASAPSAPTGYHFVGWYDAASGGNEVTGTQTITAGTSADIELYAHWSNQTTITLSKGTQGAANGSAVGTYGSNTAGSFTAVTYSGTSYRLLGYSKSGTPGEIVIDKDGHFVANTTYTDASGNWKSTAAEVTLVAQWKAGHTITWSANGTTYETSFVDSDGTIALPAGTPTSCDASDTHTYTTFIGWYTDAAGTNSAPTTDISDCGTKIVGGEACPNSDKTYYAVWGNGALVGGETKELTLDFTSNTTWQFPTDYVTSSSEASFTNTYTVKVAGDDENGYKWNSSTSALLVGKEGAYLKLPAFSFATSKLVVTGPATGASGKVTWNVFVGSTAVSTEVTGANGEHTFNIGSSYQAAGNVYIFKVTNDNNTQFKTIDVYSAVPGATGFISSCCSSAAVVTVSPESSSLALDIDGNASTSISVSQSGAGTGRYHAPTIDPAVGAMTDWEGSYKTSAYSVNFTATVAGTYTVKADFTETAAGCPKYGTATITVSANPLVQTSVDALTVNGVCEDSGTPQTFTLNSRYLPEGSKTLTITAATTSGSGAYKVSLDGSTYSTSVNVTGGTSAKATQTVYVRYDGAADETGSLAGSVTISNGVTSKVVTLSGTCSCGTYVKLTPANETSTHILAPNGQWTRAQGAIAIRANYLNSAAANVNIKLTSSNSKFKFTTGTSSGSATFESGKVVTASNNSWDGTVYIVYTPTSYNASESTTITAEVITFGGTTVHASTTTTVYGRSFPETFVLAVNTGSSWVAVPADMVAPYGGGVGICNTGVGTHDPYPITVDNASEPTVASDVPSRAIYKGANRNTPTSAPWTVQMESNSQTGYYLWGSKTANTIANQNYATGERQKWFAESSDLVTFHFHLDDSIRTAGARLGYNGSAGTVGQYTNAASAYKYDFRILPVSSTCAYFINPVMTLTAYDGTNATVSIPYDGTTNYEISKNAKSTWTDIEGALDCKTLNFTLPLATYRGQDVWLRADGTVCQGDATSESALHIPAPVITDPGAQHLYGVINVATSESFAVSSSDLYGTISVVSSNPAITANYSEGNITVNMASTAVADDYVTTLTLSSVGAANVTVDVTITIRDLAEMTFSIEDLHNGKICANNLSYDHKFYVALNNNSAVYRAADGSSLVNAQGQYSNAVYIRDLSTNGDDWSTGFSYLITSGVASFAIPTTNLVPGHTYRISYYNNLANSGTGLFNSSRLGFADAYQDFIYSSDCTAPTAMAPCLTSPTSAVANWVYDNCAGTATVSVYTKDEATLMDADCRSGGGITWNQWKQYANPSNYYDDWFYYMSLGSWTAPSSSYGPLLNKASTKGYIYSPQIGQMNGGVTITADTEIEVTVSVYCYNNQKSIQCYVIDGEPTSTSGTLVAGAKACYYNGANTKTDFYTTELALANNTTQTLNSFRIKGLTSTCRLAFTVGNYASEAGIYVQHVKVKTVTKGTPTNYTPACSAGTQVMSGLTANTQYYYTVTNSGHTSAEVAFHTWTSGPSSVKFYEDAEHNTEIEAGDKIVVLGGQTTHVYMVGQKVPGCEVVPTVSSGYGLEDHTTYDPATGALGGYIDLTLTNPAITSGTLTITDGTGSTTTREIKSSDCPTDFETLALAASAITKNSATANWNSSADFEEVTAGTLYLYRDGVVDAEYITNESFETGDLTGWNFLNVGAIYACDAYEVRSNNAHTGSHALYASDEGTIQAAFGFTTVIYGNPVTLPAGTYEMTSWVKVPVYSGYSDKHSYFKQGLAGCTLIGSTNETCFALSPDYTNIQSNNTYVQITDVFVLENPVRALPFVGHRADAGYTFHPFYLDDVSLKRISAPHSEEPDKVFPIADMSAVNSQALGTLSGNTQYSYLLKNENGCPSNTITFKTLPADGPTISAEDIEISAPAGSSATGVIVVQVWDATAEISVSKGVATGSDQITLSNTTVPQEGGTVRVLFTPNTTPGSTGTCPVTISTRGLAEPVTVNIRWAVTAGEDTDKPIIEVTEISNEELTIEHNIDADSVRIVLNREKTQDEIELNVGDEIFFSKYYEAYSHKKLWAIFNPTNDTISLAGMEVWRSSSKYDKWHDDVMDLSRMGYIKPGWICPDEEIVVYTTNQVGTCEQNAVGIDVMSTWWQEGTSSNQPLSFSGDDALLLVRNTSAVSADRHNALPTTSAKTGEAISWPDPISNARGDWYMLDIIGGRTDGGSPSGKNIQSSWHWYNSKTGEYEDGDEKGWVGYGKDMNGKNDYNTSSEHPGYLLSTNRCLLVRLKNVSSGANAINSNIDNMVTLNTEWQGSHVPTEGDQAAVSCENFSFVGSYDYAGFYNAWTEIGDYEVGAERNSDGSFTVEMDVPEYYCKTIHIEVMSIDTINGVLSENVHAYEDYKVPIVVDANKYTTADLFSFGGDTCANCDVVIRDEAKLSHVSGGVSQFRNMTVYPGASFDNSAKQGFLLDGLLMEAKNDEVGYAIINNNGSTIAAGKIVHVKRIDDQYWYPFSLPYDCDISAIRQQNGKSMGEYWEDWGIKYYDGAARQAEGSSAYPGTSSKYWKQMPVSGTLKANEAYIIGLFTTDWAGQFKSVYFPPKTTKEYTEAGDDAKTTDVYNWAEGLANDKRHHGWNFVGSPYISMFGSSVEGHGMNNSTNLILGKINETSGEYEDLGSVYVSIPDGGNSKTYTQARASATTIEPFKGYFIQTVDPDNGLDNTLNLTYQKADRMLSQAPARKATAQKQRVEVDLKAEGNGQSDIAGIIVDEKYTTDYEIGGDMTKMYAAATKPQLYFLGQDNEKMAYIAIPDANAEDIPMELYAPKAEQYIISLNKRSSRTDGAESVELLYNGNVLTNLLIDSCTINANNKGVISGYSVRIRRSAQVITSTDLINGEHVTVITNNGQMSITNLPGDAKVFVYDMTGRLMSTGNADGESVVNIDAPQQGVYNVVVQSAAGKTAIRTIVR